MQGFIDYWRADRGWGFVLTDDGGRFFAHITAFRPQPEPDLIIKGSIVDFDAGRTHKGPVAINIRVCTAATNAQRLLDAAGGGK